MAPQLKFSNSPSLFTLTNLVCDANLTGTKVDDRNTILPVTTNKMPKLKFTIIYYYWRLQNYKNFKHYYEKLLMKNLNF